MPDAELLFVGGTVFAGAADISGGNLSGGDTTSGWARSRPADVAVRDGSILAVGEPGSLAELRGAATEVVDLGGGMLLPGFQDAHVHPVQGGVELLQCDLTGTADGPECVRHVAAYAAAHPEEPWIIGAGWSMEFFPGGAPTRDLLDAVVPDRPVALSNRDHHGMWVNSAALAAAGITAATPDPADGRIERDAAGAPSGTLHEGAVGLLDSVKPPVGAELAYRGLMRAQSELLRLGITGWQDAMVGTGLGMPDGYDTYLEASARGDLTARVTGALWWERARGLEQLPGLVARRERVAASADPARLRMDMVKIMVDGVAENFTAAMTADYLDADGRPSGSAGISFLDPRSLRAAVAALVGAEFGVHFHALGDRAVREALDALEAVGPSDRRHQLAHLQVVAAADVPRFAALGAAANIQALWACHEPQLDELTLPFLASELRDRQYPFGELARAGARFAAGSDWPVSAADPLAGIRVAVTRVGTDHPHAPPLGGDAQKLPLATALAAYTSGSAWANGRDADTGRVAPGFRADLVVLDRDPFDGPPELLDETHVVSTWVDGARA
jgi:predicted amidohydrolase YtcJ